MKAMNPALNVDLFGQELNGESFAICKSDMMVKGHDASRIAYGNTLTEDAHRSETFHYMLSNPPYGVDWKKYAAPIKEEADELGYQGRFGAGLPSTSDGQLLFVQHMISKMRDDEKGSRVGIVMNGSPLFSGGAASGYSEIRRWLMETDLVEAIIALPTDIFYNTGIQTYIWILSNRKPVERRGKVQLIDASGEQFWQSMRKSLGSKRREIGDDARSEIVRIYGEFLNGNAGVGDVSKIFDTTDFGYREIRVERPLRLRLEINHDLLDTLKSDEKAVEALEKAGKKYDGYTDKLFAMLDEKLGEVWMDRAVFIADVTDAMAERGVKLPAAALKTLVARFGAPHEEAEICADKNGDPEPDTKLRDHELVPLGEDWQAYFAREVEPFVPDAWVETAHVDATDREVGRVGYEINFNRYFYQYIPPRPLEEINAELKALEAEIAGLLKEVVA